MFSINQTALTIFCVFAIALAGYVLGRIRIKGISLGTAAIFLVGLVFGHFGLELPDVLQTIGLILFITSVGFSAGPGFLQRLAKNGMSYVILCLTTAITGCGICMAVIHLGKVEAPLAVGIMTGAFTTSPGFAAAKEAVAVSGNAATIVAAGYGIVYPVGVICKVLFIQLIPKLLRANMAEERALIALPAQEVKSRECKELLRADKLGLFAFSLAVLLGIMLGSIQLPMPGESTFALGVTGGPLVAGLLLFYSGAGVQGGHGIAEIFKSYGIMPIVYGFFFVAIPMLAGFLMFRYLLKLPLLNGLGSMTASMTCTPSLAVLAQMAETDDVVAAYATTYPVALVTLVLVVQVVLA